MTRMCKRFSAAGFDNYCCETEVQRNIVSVLKHGVKNGFSRNILLIGGVGTGKTHLAYAVLNALAEVKISSSNPSYRWYSENKVIYRTAKDIIDNIRASWKEPEISDMKEFCSCPLLIIDEIGVQYGTDGERNELYTVFNRRYEDMLPIMAISNNSLTELQNILGQRIYDRLIDGALIFELNGRSHRKP